MTEPGRSQETPGRRNKLAGEKSPYLLQHAGNPVDWHPWGEEAFDKARREDKPVFLSIGYSTCHWCHVMAHESFEDEEVARLLNDAFVPVKVDREERPDVDHLYMTVCQMMTGGGGWPLTIIMTADGKPFFAGTYIPRGDRFGRIGLLELVPRVTRLWRTEREKVLAVAAQVEAALNPATAGGPASPPAPAGTAPAADAAAVEPGLCAALLDEAYAGLAGALDSKHGGFGGPPKFPSPHNLLFLLRYWKRTGRPEALAMVERTLEGMRRGGIYDQVGFGFHRYSTDDRWLVPHFEKMLYDQAMLAMAYTGAFEATGRPEFRKTAEETLAYVLRDLASDAGGFFCAEDADSEGEEGKFYLWTEEEFRQAAGEHGALAAQVYGVTGPGNLRGHPAGFPAGANVLHIARPITDPGAGAPGRPAALERRLEAAREALFSARRRRVRPGKDDKVLADWNGLMIAALAGAARAFGDPRYAAAARRAADFVLGQMRPEPGRLLHVWRAGSAAVDGCLDDYAFVVWGLIELHQAAREQRYLAAASELTAEMLCHFQAPDGGLYFTRDDGEKLLARQKQTYDGALPSGNSAALLDMVRLARATDDEGLEARAAEHARWLCGLAGAAPLAHVHFLIGLDVLTERRPA